MTTSFDVIVIGAGPAGYSAAIRCAQLGFKTACVEKWINPQGAPVLGGTCLNVGCIPSKTLLESSEQYYRVNNILKDHGIEVENVRLNLEKMMAHKESVVDHLAHGVEVLFKANGIKWLVGRGKLLADRHVEVTAMDRTVEIYRANYVILACGSKPLEIAEAPIDNQWIVDSTGGLSFTEVPERLGVIGAGVIGLELSSVWRRLGSQVTLLEAFDSFLPSVDHQIAQESWRQFTRQGLDIRLGARVIGTQKTDRNVIVRYRNKDGEQALTVDKLMVCVGRCANVAGIASPEADLLFDERGQIYVDDQCRTNLPGVYAIGDAVRGPMLAHKGFAEGIMVAELIAGVPGQVNYHTIPWVIYTDPEIAWVGKTEQTLKAEGIPYKIGQFPFSANGRAKAMLSAAGLVKILAHAETDALLGAHIVGPAASELIQEIVLAMEFSASSEDLARTIHGHPTLYEAVYEAARAVHQMALHKINLT